jgi:hypothetical protein
LEQVVPTFGKSVRHGLGFCGSLGDLAMTTTSIVPWSVFFQALKRQRENLQEAWLRYWMFSDDGAELRPKRGDRKPGSLSPDEIMKMLAVFTTSREKRRRKLH